MSKLEAVFFDLGDTLVELGEGRGSYEQRLIERVGHVYDVLAAAGVALADRPHFCRMLAEDSEAQYHAALAEQRGINIYTIVRRFLERAGIPVSDELVQAGGDAYCTGGAGVPSPLRTGAREVLAELHARGLRLGAISNTIQPARYMHRSMIRRGLAEYFDVQVYSSEIGVAKPHPAIFRAALEALDVAPEAAAHVGDRPLADVAGSQGVGMKGVLIEVAHRAEHDPAITPDARIKELPELLDVLPRLFE
jgi:HAD superfamily hydrolase (TIGR01509 family)